MRIVTLLILISITQTFALDTYAQNKQLSLNAENETIISILEEIEKQSEFYFMFDASRINVNQRKTVNCENQRIRNILDQLFEDTGIIYSINDRQVLLTTKDKSDTEQQKQVSGTVTDEAGQPLPGVTVVVKGTTQGVVTNMDGEFTLTNISDDATLQFSFVGMKTQEILVAGKTTVDVMMTEDAIGIEEVVAIGYGTQRKINLTGSVETINNEILSKRPVIQTSMALQGIAPGVTVTQSSGQPGSDAGTIRIRGLGTLGDSNPLVLIDGIEGNINGVNPEEIETINVLKDAASASIYGSRAANGVILITTKRGQEGKLRINYNTMVGWQSPTDLPKYVGVIEYLEMLNELSLNENRDPIYSEEDINNWKQNMESDPDNYPNTDWYDLLFTGSGFQQKHSFTVTGGQGMFRTSTNFSYIDQDGIIPNANYQRYSFRANNDMIVSEKFRVNFDISSRRSLRKAPSSGGIFSMVRRMPPHMPGLHSDGTWGIAWNGENPAAIANDGGLNKNDFFNLTSTIGLNYKPFSGLSFMVNFTPNFSTSDTKVFTKIIETKDWETKEVLYRVPEKNSLVDRYEKTWNYYLLTKMDWEKAFGKHRLSGLIAFEQINNRYDYLRGYREQFPLEDYQQMDSGSPENQTATGNANEWSLRSYFARINYNLADKYLLEFDIRYDGSSRFKEGRRYGVFPSLSGGWRISEEAFLSDVNFLSNLKLRASIGVLGNQNIGNYPYVSTVELGQAYPFGSTPVPINGASQTVLANPNISWESTRTLDFGFDSGFWDNKLTFTADYYIKNTYDILLRLPIPNTLGMTDPYQNAGEVENKGWEITLGHYNNIKDFKYSVKFVLSDVKNKVVDLVGTGPFISGNSIIDEGLEMNAFYGYRALGLFQTPEEVDNHAYQSGTTAPGDIKYEDQLTIDSDGDGIFDQSDNIINADDRVVIGSQIPRYTYGFNFMSEFKNFDFSFFIQGVGKQDMYINSWGAEAFYNGGNMQTWHRDRWTPDNTDASYPRFFQLYNQNREISSYWIKNAAYLRLKNIELGYTLPREILKNTFIQGTRLYFTATNLFTFKSTFPGIDPETPSGSGGSYPIVKTFNFGVNMNF